MLRFLFCICLIIVPVLSYGASLVHTDKITLGSLSNRQVFIGTIEFVQSSVVASKTFGQVLNVKIDTTSHVQAGDTLVELDHEILDSRIRAIQASLKDLTLLKEKSAKDLNRYQKLLQQKSVSQQKFDEIYYDKIRLDQKIMSTRSELEALQIERNQKRILAPFDGVVTEKHVDKGEWVETGGPIVTLVNPQKTIALFNIPASYALVIEKGQIIDVNIGQAHSNKQVIEGEVEGVIIQGDSKSRTFPLKLKLDSQNVRIFEGMEAQISLPGTAINNTLLVPRDAIVKRFGHDVVFVVEDNIAKMVPVSILLYQGNLAAISHANDQSSQQQQDKKAANPIKLKAGMQVITKGNERIFPDQSVKLQ
jgi:RND family efflux transporter MFP subunit